MSARVHIDSPADGVIASPAVLLLGWVADDSVETIREAFLVNAAGVTTPLALVDRPDVRRAVPGASTGFSAWLDIRTAANGACTLTYLHERGASQVTIELSVEPGVAAEFANRKASKLAMIRPHLRCPACGGAFGSTRDGQISCPSGHSFSATDAAYDFLTDEIRHRVGAVETENVSAHGYDAVLLDLIANADGPILDAGAGLRPDYREDVINLDIVAYPTSDVVAPSEYLPFADNTFALVISVAVLEHVRDPFAGAREITRVLRPGGKVFAAVPFLQPFHGYPDHYYNMTSSGLLNLFPGLHADRIDVPQSGGPIHALTWILRAWRDALPPDAAAQFEQLRVEELAVDPAILLDQPFVRELPASTNEQLAALNVLIASKPG